MRPYEYAFQNHVDSWLYVCDVVVIVLGCMYTLFRNSGVSITAQRAIENTLVVLLLGSLALTGIFLAWGYYFGVLRQTQDEFDALQTEWEATDAPRLTRLRGLTTGMKPDGTQISAAAPDGTAEHDQEASSAAERWSRLSKWSRRTASSNRPLADGAARDLGSEDTSAPAMYKVDEGSRHTNQPRAALVASRSSQSGSQQLRTRWRQAAGAVRGAAAPGVRAVDNGGDAAAGTDLPSAASRSSLGGSSVWFTRRSMQRAQVIDEPESSASSDGVEQSILHHHPRGSSCTCSWDDISTPRASDE